MFVALRRLPFEEQRIDRALSSFAFCSKGKASLGCSIFARSTTSKSNTRTESERLLWKKTCVHTRCTGIVEGQSVISLCCLLWLRRVPTSDFLGQKLYFRYKCPLRVGRSAVASHSVLSSHVSRHMSSHVLRHVSRHVPILRCFPDGTVFAIFRATPAKGNNILTVSHPSRR